MAESEGSEAGRAEADRAESTAGGSAENPIDSTSARGSEWDGLRSAVIVGGGIAGLVAARELAIGGMRVTLLEASGTLGGKVARHTVAGIELDSGAESFATRRGTVAEFADRLEIPLAAPDPAGAWLQTARGEAVPLPSASLLGIPGTPLAADVVAVIGFRAALRAQLDSVLTGAGAKERTLGGLVRRRMGRRVLDELVTPVAMGVHSRHPDELELDVVAPGLRAALIRTSSLAQAVLQLRAAAPAGSAVGGIDGGIYEFVAKLEERLDKIGVEVRLNTSVAAVTDRTVTLESGEIIPADRVLLATPLDRDREPGIVLGTLVVDAPELDAAPRGTGLLVAAGAPGVRAKALTHATAKWSWLASRVGAGRHVLRLSYSPAALAGVDSLEEQARADAALLLGVSIPAERVLGFDRVDWTTPAPRSSAPDGVTLIGESAAGAGLAAVIAQARSESARLLANLG